jgi:hypothetical protein
MGANAAFNYLPLLPEFTGNMDAFWNFLFYLSMLLVLVLFFEKQVPG